MNRSAVYYNSLMKEWLSQYKYRGDERYEGLISGMLQQAYDSLVQEITSRGWYMKEKLAQRHTVAKTPFQQGREPQHMWKPDVITFVPVSEQRLVERGFNQARAIASKVGASRDVPVRDLLKRNYDSEKQSYKTRAQRLASMHDLFGVKVQEFQSWLNHTYTTLGESARPISILLIDDIYTTGSTLNACSRVLQKAATAACVQVDVYGLTWARS
ncbi:ComF family protein [Paenibacillus lemnae]|uniref:ComF family protein n=1 Tax=Paenibacillus lemnae TaxID=1330551 RepID=A0A848M8U8_PAELE|nr:ComF family protein [Paenibacillus lemnae]NMO96610.1 ComF family protein [Paenibacillus lemnae]